MGLGLGGSALRLPENNLPHTLYCSLPRLRGRDGVGVPNAASRPLSDQRSPAR